MALSGKKQGTVTANSSKFTYYLEWSATQSIANNTSTITVRHYWRSPSSTDFDSVGTRRYGITIDGVSDTGTKRMDYDPYKDKDISTFTHTVTHNADGTKSITISTYANGKAASYGPSSESTSSGDCKASVTITLDTIPRAATIVEAPNFTDEENPVLKYNNSAGNNVTTLQAGIYGTNGSTVYVAYRDINKTGNSYTFTLTDAERTVLRKAATKNTLDVKFYIKTIIGGNTYYNSVTKQLKIVNNTPTLSPTVIDSNQTTVGLTGSNNTIVKYYSNAQYTINAKALKEATITSQSVTNEGKSSTSASGTINAVESKDFVFKATDSRGNEVTKTITKNFVDYVKLTCNIASNKPDGTGEMIVECSGNYFDGSFGKVENALTVQYRYKVSGGTYSNWTAMTVTKSGNTYTAKATKTGLDYKKAYIFQTQAIDKLNPADSNGNSPIQSIEYKTVSIPIFDWGENDFKVNGDLNVTGNINVDGLLNITKSVLGNIIYPVGSIYMSMTNTDPGTLFGGTWERIQDRFLLAAGSTYAINKTGGAATVKLTAAQSGVPAHTHPDANFYLRHGNTSGTATAAAGTNTTVTDNAYTESWGNGWEGTAYSHKPDKVTIKTVANTAAAATQAHENMPPYITVYVWQRKS